MIDLPCEKNKSPAPGIYQIQSAFLNSLLHRTLTCPAAGFYTEETLQLRGAGHKHHWDFFCLFVYNYWEFQERNNWELGCMPEITGSQGRSLRPAWAVW